MAREGYKETELGEVPVEWEVKSFSEACDRLLNGGTPNTQVPKYWDGSIPWVTGADVVNQKIENIRRYITEQAVEDSSTSVIPKECLLVVTRTGVGKLAITPFDVAISQDITGVIPKKDYDIGYLFWALNASGDYFQNLTQGTSINGITRNDLILFKFAVPPLPEQRRIASVLSTIDEAIEKTEALIAKLRQVKAGLMQDLLTKGIDEEGRVRSEETHAFKDSEIGRVPVEWEIKLLNELCQLIQDGTHFSPKVTDYGVYKYITSKNIRFGKMDLSNIETIDKKSHDEIYSKCPVQKLDVLLTKDGVNTGNAAINYLDEEFSLLSSVVAIRTKQETLVNVFLLQYLLSDEGQTAIKESMKGLAISRITLQIIKEIRIPVPNLREQNYIVDILTAADDRIAREEAYRDKLLAMKKGLMADLLTGRVRVPEGVAE